MHHPLQFLIHKYDGSSVMELPSFLLFALDECVPAKQEGGAPDTGKANNGVDQPAEQGTLSAKKPGHQIELKQTNQTPVQASDHRQNQCNGIHDKTSFFPVRS